MEVVIGVDGGGSKTRVVALPTRVDSTIVIAESLGSGTNHNSVGKDEAAKELKRLIQSVLESTRSKDGNAVIKGVCLGMSGVDREEDELLVRCWIRGNYSTVIALAAGAEGDLDGVVVISGTGTIAMAITDGGSRTARAQGWGPMLGDIGSGYWIASEAMIAYARAVDGLTGNSTLVEEIQKHLNLKRPDELIAWTYADMKWERFASLTPVVDKCARRGDGVAISIYDRAAKGLCDSITRVILKLNMESRNPLKIVFAGGMITHDGALLAEKLSMLLLQKFPTAVITPTNRSSEVAAAMIAQRKFGETGS